MVNFVLAFVLHLTLLLVLVLVELIIPNFVRFVTVVVLFFLRSVHIILTIVVLIIKGALLILE